MGSPATAAALGLVPDPRYRTATEPQIIELLLLHGWVQELRAGRRDRAAGEASAMLDRLTGSGLGHREADGGRLFDPAEVLNVLKSTFRQDGHADWRRVVENGRSLVRNAAPDARGASSDTGVVPSRRFDVRLERTFHRVTEGSHGAVRLRVPLAIEDDILDDLTVRPVVPCGVDAALSRSVGRLDAIVRAPCATSLTLGVHMAFNARSQSVRQGTVAMLSPADRELYTRAHEGMIDVTPRIAALAAHVGGRAGDDWSVVERFWDYLLAHFHSGAMHYQDLGAAPLHWVLDTGWYDCHVGSALLVALCRARAIPARLVSGYVLYRDAPFHHFWMEAWTKHNGWRPCDLICWDLAAGGIDVEWRRHFFGQLDYRMKTQLLPRIFTGLPSIRLPSAWHLLARATPDGSEMALCDAVTGLPIYTERLTVSYAESAPLARGRGL